MSAADANSVGEALRQERLRRQLSLAIMARETRICVAILDAIERNHFDGVPKGAYRWHFVRQYACALGMNGDAAVAAFRRQHEEPLVSLPTPPKRRRSRLWGDAVRAALIGAAVVSAWEFTLTKDRATKHLDKAWLHAESVSRPPKVVEPPRPTAPHPVSQPAPVAALGPVLVAFTATEPVWVNVKCDGVASFAGVLEALQSKTFNATSAVRAVIGNAGGLKISLNGSPLGPLGGHGEVQTVELTLKGAHRISHHAASGDESVPQS